MNFRAISMELYRLGLPCFPVRDKRPLVEWAEYQKQPPTKAEYLDWYDRFPDADAGIPTGRLIVLDADSLDAVRELWRRGLPATWATGTTRGTHYYYKSLAGLRVRNSASEIAEHVDLRGWGGFVVWHPWLKGYSPDDVELADPPEWLMAHLRAKEEARQAAPPPAPAVPFIGTITPWADAVWKGELERLQYARNGNRNHTLNRVGFVCGRLIGGGELPEGQVRQSLIDIAAPWKDEPLAASLRTIDHAIAEGKAQPRIRPVAKAA